MTGTILVVDDSALARRKVREVLEPAGYEVIEATDGLVALEQYFLHKPKVVLVDLVMTGMSGLDLLKKLREFDPDARVLIVSADVQISSQELAGEAGAKGFLSKPFEKEALLDAVRDALAEVH
jgi:two-component system, chemotaxis family, chemotaxis protein CheY